MKRLILFCLLAISLQACQPTNERTTEQNISEKPVLETPFVHSVYIWFKEGVTQEQLSAFYADTDQLETIEVVKALYTGKPAATNRPIVENTYDFAIIVHFENLAEHDVYQEHPTHKALLKKHAQLWERVMITDVEK